MKIRSKPIIKTLKLLFLSLGAVFFVMLVLAFTSLPFWARYRLATVNGCISRKPALIVQMGGNGMPSDDGLIRSYYTAGMARQYKGTPVVIAFPGNPSDSLSSLSLFKKELVLRGLPDSLIQFENKGRNTRQQALFLAETFHAHTDTGLVVLVTSPEHMYRAIQAFKKAGFRNVTGLPTFERSVSEDELYYTDSELKGNTYLPPVGHSKQLRYQFWNHLGFEINVLREYIAIGYYKLRAWI